MLIVSVWIINYFDHIFSNIIAPDTKSLEHKYFEASFVKE